MPFWRKQKSRTTAPAIVYFGLAMNAKGQQQPAVWAECTYGGMRVGPVWSHVDASVRRCLSLLTSHCDCGRKRHRTRYSEGRRMLPAPHVP